MYEMLGKKWERERPPPIERFRPTGRREKVTRKEEEEEGQGGRGT